MVHSRRSTLRRLLSLGTCVALQARVNWMDRDERLRHRREQYRLRRSRETPEDAESRRRRNRECMWRRQEVVLADGTAACRCVLWEAHTDQLKEGNSYKFENVTIRSYNGSKYLSAGEKAVISSVEDIGYIVDDLCCDKTGRIMVVKAEIVEVTSIDSYKSCRNCNGKVAETKNLEIGECTSHAVWQQLLYILSVFHQYGKNEA